MGAFNQIGVALMSQRHLGSLLDLILVRSRTFQSELGAADRATFDQYLQTGEKDWPLLLPMVKSSVRAMDAMQSIVREKWGAPIESFTVSGAGLASVTVPGPGTSLACGSASLRSPIPGSGSPPIAASTNSSTGRVERKL